jgi:hypothetical protein
MSAFEADRFNHSRTSPRQNKGFGKKPKPPLIIPSGLALRDFRLRPSIPEKILQQLGAFFREHTRNDFHLMIQRRVIQHLQNRFHRACLRISSSVNQARYSSLDQRTCAHGAWLNGDVELTLEQPMISNTRARIPQGDDLSVRTGVSVGQVTVAPATDNFVTQHYNSPYRHLAHGLSRARLS